MLVAAVRVHAAPWRRLLGLGMVLLLLAVLLVWPHLRSGMELVRLRNALLLAPEPQEAAAFDWKPDAPPPDFVQEDGAIEPTFVSAVQSLQLAGLDSDWERVLAISRHLLQNPHLVGTPIQSNLRETYRSILVDGTGYCGDFTRVFMAFALASGMPVRAWSFSLDGFGGHGHVWPEVWNRQLQQWQLVDVFNNYYFARADGVALSALALHHALSQGDTSLRLLPLAPLARPGYSDSAKAWDYYRSGLNGWYLAWGNSVFSYDRAPLVRSLAPMSHALSQLGGVVAGVLPRIHILSAPQNAEPRAALLHLRYRLLAAAVLAGLTLLALVGGVTGWIADACKGQRGFLQGRALR